MKRFLSSPIIIALAITAAFFFIYLGVFRPGYFYVNDDLKMIWIMAGYPAGKPAPFLIHTNILLGFLLTYLYGLPSNLNWEILFFFAINFLSILGTLCIILSSSQSAHYKLFGVFVALGCDAFFMLNITYTLTAAFAEIGGICLIWHAVLRDRKPRNGFLIWGIVLIVVGSFIRFQTLAIVLPPALVATLFLYSLFNPKRLALTWGLVAVLVSSAYAFDQVYVRLLAPDWHVYNVYQTAREAIYDTHRLENLHGQIQAIGWSKNDQELFARWFFPDQDIYSLEHLQYLVDHVPGTTAFDAGLIQNYIRLLFSPLEVPYFLLLAAIGLFILHLGRPVRWAILGLLATLLVVMSENLYLAWSAKDVDRILLPSLACVVTFGIMFANRHEQLQPLRTKSQAAYKLSLPLYGALLCLLVALGMILNQSVGSTVRNIQEQTAYRQILADLRNLQRDGKLANNALIISPERGLPLSWADPFILEFPSVSYLDTGWFTFSPAYQQVLQKFDIGSLPDALYQKNNVYLMNDSAFTIYLARYYQEHEHITVDFQPIYTMPNIYNFTDYENIQLYKVVMLK